MKHQHKAVILGCNYYIGLSVIRCLGTQGIHTVAVDYSTKDNYGARSKYCSERLIGPRYNDDPEGFIHFLIQYAKQQKLPPVLIPCHDNYAEMIDSYYQELSPYYLISQSETGITTRLMEKDSLYRIAQEKGVRIPETLDPEDPNLLEKVSSQLGYPCIIKPVDSPAFTARFRRKIFFINNEQELIAGLNQARGADLAVFVQRIIPGFDDYMYTFDGYMDRSSKVVQWATCQKYRQFPINFGASVYTGHKYVPELYEISSRFFEAVKYKGVAEIEFKKDAKTGQFYLIEINVRITNFNNLLYKLGINMPDNIYRELTGLPVEAKAFDADRNLVFWYGYEDMLAIRDYLKTGQLTLGQVLKSLTRPKANAIWDWSDPAPGLFYLKLLGGKVWKKLTRAK